MTQLEQQTSDNRFRILIDLNHIISYAESQITRSKNIPIIDDAEHADWVQGFADRVHEIFLDMSELSYFGHRNGGIE